MRFWFPILLTAAFASAGYGQLSKPMIENAPNPERTVKGAPFSAEAVIESVQILMDGNKITRRATSRMYRDSEGRFRREDMPKYLNVPGAVVEMPESILIVDPIAGYQYIVDSKKQTVNRTPLSAFREFRMKGSVLEINTLDAAEKQVIEKIKKEDKLGYKMSKTDPSDSTQKTEPLGTQNIEGVEAEGTRTTITIPAGEIGNERAIDLVYERWYSKDLHLIVLSKRTDPRIGEQTYSVTNISRNKQPMSLFAPPADYTVVDDRRLKPIPALPKTPSVARKPSAAPAAASEGKKP